MVTVGVANGQIEYVSSSLTKTTGSPAAATLSPLQGWLKAAENVGRAVPGGQVGDIVIDAASPTASPSSACRASHRSSRRGSAPSRSPTARSGRSSRPTSSTSPAAPRSRYTLMVDAVSGKVLHRHNKVDNDNGGDLFNGSTHRGRVRPDAPLRRSPTAPPSRSSLVSAAAPRGRPRGQAVRPQRQPARLGRPGAPTPRPRPTSRPRSRPGTYTAQVCPYDDPDRARPTSAPTPLTVGWHRDRRRGAGQRRAQPEVALLHGQPEPRLRRQRRRSRATPSSAAGSRAPGCDLADRPARATSSAPGPWDTIAAGGTSTQTTRRQQRQHPRGVGQPADARRPAQAPISADPRVHRGVHRRLEQLEVRPEPRSSPGGNDINASVANLFVSHNRMHDYSLLPGLHRVELQPAGRQPAAAAASAATRRSATPRPAR